MKIVEIKLTNKLKKIYASYDNIELKIGDSVIIEVDKTLNIGKLLKYVEKNLNEEKDEMVVFPIIRKATKDDLKTNLENIKDANNAFKKCENLIRKYELDMKLVDATYTLDKKQLIFQFTSENRVDFRDLAKELASIYKTRIELRQIGVRDKAKCVGGVGICGKELCCSQFLNEMDTVSINMAKNQKLALNPNKINGVCGRLLCCLKYEDNQYCQLKKGLPEIGDIVNTEFGTGTVTDVNICNRTYKVDIPSHGKIEINL